MPASSSCPPWFQSAAPLPRASIIRCRGTSNAASRCSAPAAPEATRKCSCEALERSYESHSNDDLPKPLPNECSHR